MDPFKLKTARQREKITEKNGEKIFDRYVSDVAMGQVLSRNAQIASDDFSHILKAVESGNLHQLKRLTDGLSVADIQAVTKSDGKTLLHTAVFHHQLQCVEFLLELGMNANLVDNSGNAPLLEIINKTQDVCLSFHKPDCLEKLVSLLLKFKADINARGSVHRTALLKSLIHRHRLSEILLKNGADPDIADDDGLLPIHVCATYSCVPLLKQVLAAGADLNGTDSKERTALYFSVLAGHQKVFNELLRNGCDINMGSLYGYPLQTAIIKCRLEMVESLLRKGVYVQCRISEFRQSYSKINDYLNLALLTAHSQINNSDLGSANENAIEKAKQSLQILLLVLQAVGQNVNFTKNAFVKMRRPPLERAELSQCRRMILHLVRKLAFVHGMNWNLKPLESLPKLGSDIDTRSLQNICRMEVRKLIAMSGTNVIFVVDHLDCSRVLKDIILLKDIL